MFVAFGLPRVVATAVVGAVLFSEPTSAQTIDPNRPAALVMRLHDGIMAAAGVGWPPDRRTIAQLVGNSFDLPAIASTVLGAHAAAATPAQRERLARALGNLLVRELMRRRPIPGDRFTVIETRATRPGEWLVITSVTPSGEANINLIWRVRAESDGLRIIDTLRDGVSAVITEKSDIASALRNSTLDAVISELERRAAASGS